MSDNKQRKKPSTESINKRSTSNSRQKVPTTNKNVVGITKTNQKTTTARIVKPVISGTSSKKVIEKPVTTKSNTLTKKVILKENTISKKEFNKKISSSTNNNDKLISIKEKVKQQQQHESRSSSRLARDRTRTRTLSPGESKLIHLTTVDIDDSNVDEDEENYYESDFESDFESESSSSSSDDEDDDDGPKEMISLPEKSSIITKSIHEDKSNEINKIKKVINEPPVLQTQKEEIITKETPTIDFKLARKRHAQRQAMEKLKERGKQLLSMIKLDTVSFTLLDLPPSKYETLMSKYGVQALTQTGDELLDEEIQTDEIELNEKWTQYPPFIDNNKLGFQTVGPINNDNKSKWPNMNYKELEESVNKCAEIMFILLSENNEIEDKQIVENLGLTDVADGGYKYGKNIEHLLKNKTATKIEFIDSNRFVSLHTKTTTDEKDIICIWNISMTQEPIKILVSRPNIISFCYHYKEWPNLFISACKDGTICLWNLKDSITYQPYEIINNDIKLYLQNPSYITSEYGNESHEYNVIKVLPSNGDQFISIDIMGHVFIWSVIYLNSQVKLVKSNTIDVSIGEAEVTDATMVGDRLLLTLNSNEIINLSLIGKPMKRILADELIKHCHCYYNTKILISPNNKNNQFLITNGEDSIKIYELGLSRPIWNNPKYELGESKFYEITWGKCGIICLLSGYLFLWHPTKSQPELICKLPIKLSIDIVTINASHYSNLIALSTRDGELIILNVKIIE